MCSRRGRALAVRRMLAAGATAGVLALAGCAAPAEPAPPSTSPSPVAEHPSSSPGAAPQVRDVATGLTSPWSVVFLADGTPLVSERDTANILELRPDGSARVIGTVPGVAHGGEGGLLGLAVGADEQLYVYSTGVGGNRIQRFALSGAPGALALGDADTVLDGLPAARTHNGGRIAFGPDGMLYATAGDAGTPSRAQDPDSLGGKLLRMTPDGEAPDDNPIAGSLVYSLGHRNPQGIGWAPDGTLFLAEFGQDTWDELNIIEPGGNYGWPEAEGIAGNHEFIDPVQQWPTDQASPSGLAVTGDAVYLANLRGERLTEVLVADTSTTREHLLGAYGRLRDAIVAPDGTLWITTNNTDGRGEPRPGDDRIVSIPLDSL